METIKKYQNRKLYSTMQSKYVTLEYIKDLVKADQVGKFQVICNKNGEDITDDVLQQVLMITKPSREDKIAFIKKH